MEVLKGEDYFSHYEFCEFLLEEVVLVKLSREVSVLAELTRHEEVLWSLESVKHAEDEGMIEIAHDLTLSKGIFNLIVYNEEILLHNLDSYRFFIWIIYFQSFKNSSEGTISYFFLEFKVS